MTLSVEGAAIVAIIIESILYGSTTFLFGITLWTLTYQRKSGEVSHLMVAAACLLFFLSTLRLAVDVGHVWRGFISSGNSENFFNDVSNNTFKNAVYTVETLVGDAILIYRCYVVWRQIHVIIISIIGWIVLAATGIYLDWLISQLSSDSVFLLETGKWVVAFYAVALITNLYATCILAFRLWLAHRDSTRISHTTRSQTYPILLIIIECGALYSMALIAMMVTYLAGSNGAYIVIDMIGQLIPFTFYLIIARVAVLRCTEDTGQGLFTSTMTHAGHSDCLLVFSHSQANIDDTAMMDLDNSKLSRVSSAHIRTLGDTYHPNAQKCLYAEDESRTFHLKKWQDDF